MLSLQVVEERVHTYRGATITIYRAEHPFHGSFWGWRVGDKRSCAYRHSNVCFDVARAYVDSRQR